MDKTKEIEAKKYVNSDGSLLVLIQLMWVIDSVKVSRAKNREKNY